MASPCCFASASAASAAAFAPGDRLADRFGGVGFRARENLLPLARRLLLDLVRCKLRFADSPNGLLFHSITTHLSDFT